MDSSEKLCPSLFGTSTSFSGGNDAPSYSQIARSSSAAASMEALHMQSLLQQQQQQHHKGLMMMNTMSPPLPPPAAMSLRARETAAMSLKHIFEQQMSNGASSREQECNKSTQGQQIGGFQVGMRNMSMPDLRNRVPELDLTFRKAQDSNFANAQTGFGSPISTPMHANDDLLSQAPLPMNSQLVQHNHVPQSARLSPPSRQPTAQMTVFYSGSVNVYEDVPADKAHAIMLLAGNSWSTSFKCPAVPAKAAPGSVCAEAVVKKERALSPMKPASSQQEAPSLLRNVPASTAPAIFSIASPPPSPAPVSVSDGGSTAPVGMPVRRPHAGIELPHARKASLARFLEKRKDRVQVQQLNPDVGEKGGGGDDGGETASCSGKRHDHDHDHDPHPTMSSGKKPRMSSRSPSPSRSSNIITNNRDNSTTTTTITTTTKNMESVEDGSSAKKGIHSFFN